MIDEEFETGENRPRPDVELQPGEGPTGLSSPEDRRTGGWILFALLAFFVGLGAGYLAWGRELPAGEAAVSAGPASRATATPANHSQAATQGQQISLPANYTLPVAFGDVGPQLVEAGAIDAERFAQLYTQRGRPLTAGQLAILNQGSDELIQIDSENAQFLLNFFWALGLANQNPILTEGPMMQYSEGNITRFASTGGWTLGTKPAAELYAGTTIITLTAEQQARLEEVAAAVYRPCCNNSTLFPDCNHGMAMLGLLELMASQAATAGQMFEAAKYVNAFWFPQQTLELAAFFQVNQGVDFAQVEPRQVVSANFSSGNGFRAAHQWLVDNGALQQAPNEGGSCGV